MTTTRKDIEEALEGARKAVAVLEVTAACMTKQSEDDAFWDRLATSMIHRRSWRNDPVLGCDAEGISRLMLAICRVVVATGQTYSAADLLPELKARREAMIAERVKTCVNAVATDRFPIYPNDRVVMAMSARFHPGATLRVSDVGTAGIKVHLGAEERWVSSHEIARKVS